MRRTNHVLTSSAVVVCLAVSLAHGQAPKPSPAQQSLEVSLQQRVAALEKEVQNLKGELAALRAQIQRSGSTQTPVVSGSGSIPNGARPSQAEIQACVNASSYGDFPILQLEFGTPITSQGGLMELAMDAPKGTIIFPTKIHFAERPGFYSVWTTWVFRDSFGTLQCKKAD